MTRSKDNPKTENKRKLTSDQAREIRKRFIPGPLGNKYELCHEFKIGATSIERIIAWRTYKEAK